MRRDRQNLILNLIKNNHITTQEELLNKLLDAGIKVTQATVSRDIKDLGLVKLPSANGNYKYCISSAEIDDDMQKYRTIFIQSALLADCAGHICSIKCRVGTANAACAALDSMNWADMVGTLAGDDTIFVLCRTNEAAIKIKESIEKLLS